MVGVVGLIGYELFEGIAEHLIDIRRGIGFRAKKRKCVIRKLGDCRFGLFVRFFLNLASHGKT